MGRKTLNYAAVCTGLATETVAWHDMWEPVFFAEIDPFCRSLLAQRWPGVQNRGDFTTINGSDSIDLLMGGTPCQSFSVAGRRGGLDDARGVLAFEFLRLAGRLCPRWLLWENVPGILSSGDGRDFGAFLGTMAKLGYGWAYRILDAQYFGVAQRRKRVFVVGHLGDWRHAAAVLFERSCLSGRPAPGREEAEDIAYCVASRSGGSQRNNHENNYVAHALRADGFDASEDGTGRGTPLVACALRASNGGVSSGHHSVIPTAFNWQSSGSKNFLGLSENKANAIHSQQVQAIAFNITGMAQNGRNPATLTEVSGVLQSKGLNPTGNEAGTIIAERSLVRRLTPRECERLMGLPDDYTLIDYRGKPARDGPRYRVIGNSIAVPVLSWLGHRIDAVEALES